MADPLADRDALDSTLEFAANEARRYVEALSGDPVSLDGSEAIIEGWSDPMPEAGDGSLAALRELAARGRETAMRSSGPRFFHFAPGGGTPAAIGADWLTSAYDQAAYAWASSPFAARLEQVAIDWLRQLFELPAAFGGVLTTGATMANFVALAAARNWWGERLGVDVEQEGIASLSGPLIASSGYLHPSAVQAIGMLGLGQGNIRRLVRDRVGRFDVERLDRELTLHGEPAIVIANAGEVNSGDFDPIEAIADVVERHHAWLHVDGAFGLFARLAPEARRLTAGIERADSVIADGHKWLNVPYDCGVAFIDDPILHRDTFSASAAYLESGDERPAFGDLAPEMSRRARALPAWATLRAYGRDGYRAMVERHLELARRLADQIDAEPDLERLADVVLNVVCFRYHPPDALDSELDALNRRLGDAVLENGQIYFGTTVYAGRVAFRPAIVNWRTQPHDIDLIVPTVLRLGRRLQASNEPSPVRPE